MSNKNTETKTVKAELVNTGKTANMNEYVKIPFDMAYADWYNEKFGLNSDKTFMSWLKGNMVESFNELKPYVDQFNNGKMSGKICDTYISLHFAQKGLINDSGQPVVKLNFSKVKFSNEPMTLKSAIKALVDYKKAKTTTAKTTTAKGKK